MNSIFKNKSLLALFMLSTSFASAMQAPEGRVDNIIVGRAPDYQEGYGAGGGAFEFLFEDPEPEQPATELVPISQVNEKPLYNREREIQLRELSFTPNDYPGCHHYFFAQRFQEIIDKAYNLLESREDQQNIQHENGQAFTLEELREQLREEQNRLSDVENRIRIQQEFLVKQEHPKLNDQIIQYLKRCEERALQQMKTIRGYAQQTYRDRLKEIQEQIKAFEEPLDVFKWQRDTQLQAIEALENQINHYNNPQDNVELMRARQAFTRLAGLKVKTVYNLDNLGIHKGILLHPEDMRPIMQSFIDRNDPIFGRMEINFLYRLCVNRLEFPDLQHLGGDINVKLRFEDQIKELSRNLSRRLQEDIFSFDLLIALIDPQKLDLTKLKSDAQELYQKAIRPSAMDDIYGDSQNHDLRNDARIFGQILKLYKSELVPEVVNFWSQALFENVSGGLLGHLLVGLRHGSAFSWQKADELAPHVSIRNKLAENRNSDVSNEMVNLVQRILLRHINWCTLRCIGEKFKINWDK